MITILENVSLKLHSTMRLGGTARFACTITSEEELLEALGFAQKHSLPVRAIGEGSNIIWRDEGYSGLLLINKIEGFELLDTDDIRFGAGMNWDQAVNKTTSMGLSGLEYLSLIPGTVGATPVQNVGAYGMEVSKLIVSVRAYDMHKQQFITIINEDCEFEYRTSRFKTTDSGRFIITSVTFHLSRSTPQAPFYEALQQYFDTHAITSYTPTVIRDAVIDIRSNKLPDPKVVANNGSFFANPVIEQPLFERLQSQYPSIKGWPFQNGKVKVAAGWLMEHAGFNDYHDNETGMATWSKQNLVLVNEHASSTQQLEIFKQKILSRVNEQFGIMLEQEPELLP